MPAAYAVYLDVCCLNRPFDDQSQARVRLEAEAVVVVLGMAAGGGWRWIASDAVVYEVARTPDPGRRARVDGVLSGVGQVVGVDDAVERRAEELAGLEFGGLDALHVACAERGAADVLLTTDDRLLRLAARHAGALRVRVANVLTWVGEVTA